MKYTPIGHNEKPAFTAGRGRCTNVSFEQLLDLRLQQVAQAMDSFSDVLGIHR
jgi:hypothetical protein